jgi:heme exporter protein A
LHAPAIEAVGLEKRYGRRRALSGLTATVAPGECLALLGPNGAGKSTFLRLAAGLARPTAGELRVLGRPARSPESRAGIGYLGHRAGLYAGLTARENLRLHARLHGLAEGERRVEAALERVGLARRAAEPVRAFSQGMKQRLGLARVLLHEPPLLLLDEPFSGLDAEGARVLEEVLAAQRAAGRTVVLVTHDADAAVRLATRLVVQEGGAWVTDLPAGAVNAEGLRRELAARAAAGGVGAGA